MKQFDWDEEKNELLQVLRKVSFEEIEDAIASGGLLDVVPHHNKKLYPDQKIFIVKTKKYIYQVPFVENDKHIFLKTIIPNRKIRKTYEK